MHIARWFTAEKTSLKLGVFAAALLAPALLLAQTAPASSTLDRVRTSGKMTFGYFAAARPLSYRNSSGNADGYSVALCRGIAAIVKQELDLPNLSVQFTPIDADPIGAVRDGRIDLLCAPMQPTLSRRADVSFSLPVFSSGTGMLMRKDGSREFREAIEGRKTDEQPLWRGSPRLAALNQRNFAVVAGSSAERRLTERKGELNVTSVITPVRDLQAGLQRVLRRESDAFVGDRSVLLDLAHNDPAGKDLIVVDRLFDHTSLSLAMRRGDEDLRLLVDKTLSRLYRTGRIDGIYQQHLGKPDAATHEWFQRVAEPE